MKHRIGISINNLQAIYGDFRALEIAKEVGADAVDFVLVNRVQAGDLVVTQDYGLAAMCLARGADALRQDGVFYTNANMDGLLESRHFSQKIRRAGGRTKGPKKRTAQDDQAYLSALDAYIKEKR